MRILKNRSSIYFILPGFILYTAFVVYPIFSSIPYSLTRWSGIGPKAFIGFDNYRLLFNHPSLSQKFFSALWHNLELYIFYVIVATPLCLLLGYIISRKIHGYRIFQTIIFAPHFVNVISIGFMMTLFFDPSIGLYGVVMRGIGLENLSRFPLYDNPDYSLFYLFMVTIWKGVGYSMMLFIANFQSIPEELEEAAYIDGANERQRFLHILLPLSRPTITNVIILSYIWALTAFDLPYIIGGSNGGVGGVIDFVGLLFYRTAFGTAGENNIGMGTTIAVCMFVLVLAGSLIQLLIVNRKQIDYQ